jgi:transcriptional regulator PpsR
VNTRPGDALDLNALSGLAPKLASAFVALSSDIALVIDADGSVRQVVQGSAPLAAAADAWIGRPWADTVTRETRVKIEQLLKDVNGGGVARRREVNLLGSEGGDVPVAYAAIRLGHGGPVLAVGRDLRAIAAIQQRFSESQQEMERDYWKRRHAESRYRLLFQVATDAVMMVDALTFSIVEANRAAGELFGFAHEHSSGKHASVGIDPPSWPAVEELLTVARSTGRPAEIRARRCGGGPIDVSATPFRSDRDLLLLVRARVPSARSESTTNGAQWVDLVRRLPDAVAIADSGGHVLLANPAFLELCQLAAESQVDQRSLGVWLSEAGAMSGLLAQTKRHGIASLASARWHGERGRALAVSISAVLLDDGDRECVGFTIRRASSHVGEAAGSSDDLGASLDALLAPMGRKALPQLLGEASAIVERHLMRSALRRVNGDPNAAAALLGIDAASLAQRMRDLALALDGSDAVAPPTTLN